MIGIMLCRSSITHVPTVKGVFVQAHAFSVLSRANHRFAVVE